MGSRRSKPESATNRAPLSLSAPSCCVILIDSKERVDTPRKAQMKTRSPQLLLIVTFLLLAGNLWACKYSVRDVGFVDLASTSYRLYIITHPGKSRGDLLSRFDESNVLGEVVTTAEDHPIIEEFGIEVAEGQEIALLVSDDRRSITVELDRLDGILDSPVRKTLLKTILRAHSIVLTVEGDDPDQNAFARTETENAIARVSATMDSLPKPIDEPPHAIVIPSSHRQTERLLLWGLGIDPDDGQTHVAVLIGRLRRLGPVLTFPGTDSGQLERNLHLIGQDCECGLDSRWMQGPMVPHSWDSVQQARAMMALGFDPQNPMVQVEIRRILSRQVARLSEGSEPSGEETLVGYEEVALGGAPEKTAVEPTTVDSPSRGSVLWSLLGISLAALLAGALFLLLGSKREAR